MEQQFRNMAQKEVGGVMYDIYCLPPALAYEKKAELLKLVLPVVGSLVPSGNIQDLFGGDVNIDNALGTFSAILSPKQFTELTLLFLKRVKRDGQPIDIDVEFMGRTGQMLLLFWACLEVNYADFFDVCRAKAGFLKELLTPAKAPSVGKSGD